MNEDILKIFNGVDLSEEVKTKIASLINSEIEDAKQKAEEEAEEKYAALAEQYSQYVVAEMEDKAEQYINEEFMPAAMKYINYAAKEFMAENKLAIESGIKVQLAESFLSGLSNVAEAFNVKVPEGAEDLLAEATKQNKDLQSRIDQLIDQNNQLQESIKQSKKDTLIELVAEGMTETRKEKFAQAAAKVKFVNEDQYKEALIELKESFVPTDKKENKQEQLGEQVDVDTVIAAKNSWLDSLVGQV